MVLREGLEELMKPDWAVGWWRSSVVLLEGGVGLLEPELAAGYCKFVVSRRRRGVINWHTRLSSHC